MVKYIKNEGRLQEFGYLWLLLLFFCFFILCATDFIDKFFSVRYNVFKGTVALLIKIIESWIRMTKRLLSIVLLISLVFSFAACGGEQSAVVDATKDIWLIDEENKLSEFDSPYTAGYQNEDGTFTLYIFSAPVQYKVGNKKYSPIDNSLVTSEKKDYAFENKANSVKVYFPKELSGEFLVKRGFESVSFKLKETESLQGEKLEYINMYGDTVQAVSYKDAHVDYVFYPTNAGIKMEFVLKDNTASDKYEMDFDFSQKNISSEINKKYVTFVKKDKVKSIFYPSLNMDNNGTLTPNIIDCKENTVVLTAEHKSEYPIKVDASFELYENKLPDSTVNSNNEPNSYLSNYFWTTNDSSNGMTRQYTRLRINYFFKTNAENIKSASFNIKALDKLNKENIHDRNVVLQNVCSQWSSTKLSWEEQGMRYDTISENPAQGMNGYCLFEITNFMKECVSDINSMSESWGLAILDEDENTTPTFFASSDNTLYPTYIKIEMKSLPDEFYLKDNINDIAY
ncbi:MAG: hypothetical protein IJN85_05055 [Oscillospiraceae bacterium]|nr:hypothetical protein [Oscillospiraceae bacterium]